jgi:hypothetical protein
VEISPLSALPAVSDVVLNWTVLDAGQAGEGLEIDSSANLAGRAIYYNCTVWPVHGVR